MAEDIKSLMVEKLNQTYTAEKLILQTLPKLRQAASSQKLKQAFDAHRQETEQQVTRLEQAGQEIGVQIKGAPCEAMEGLAAEGERLISHHKHGPMLDVALVAAAQAVEHHEIAVYGTMRSLARSAGMQKVAHLMEQTLQGRRPLMRN